MESLTHAGLQAAQDYASSSDPVETRMHAQGCKLRQCQVPAWVALVSEADRATALEESAEATLCRRSAARSIPLSTCACSSPRSADACLTCRHAWLAVARCLIMQLSCESDAAMILHRWQASLPSYQCQLTGHSTYAANRPTCCTSVGASLSRQLECKCVHASWQQDMVHQTGHGTRALMHDPCDDSNHERRLAGTHRKAGLLDASVCRGLRMRLP